MQRRNGMGDAERETVALTDRTRFKLAFPGAQH